MLHDFSFTEENESDAMVEVKTSVDAVFVLPRPF